MVAGLFPQSPGPGLCPCVWQWLFSLGGISPQVNCVAQLSNCLGWCPPSDNFPVVNDTDATTLTSCFPSSLPLTMTPETINCSCSARAKMSLCLSHGELLGDPRSSQQCPFPMQVVLSLFTQRDVPWGHGDSPVSQALPPWPSGTLVTWTVYKGKGPGPPSGLSPPGRAPCPVGPCGEGGRIFCS